MNEDSSDIFKVFRVLWFPTSVNAVVLGAIAGLLFWLLTWCGLEIFDVGGEHDEAATHSIAFFAKASSMVISGGGAWSLESGSEKLLFCLQLIGFFILWSTVGVAICRILALRVARDEYCTLGTAFGFAWRVKMTGLLYPIAILLPVLVLAGGNAALGLLGSIPVVGWFLGVFLVPLAIIASLLILLIMLFGLVGVGLVPAAIATERKGTYDSLGKAFNYVFARPLQLILYLVLLYAFISVLEGLLIEANAIENIMRATLTPFGWETDYDAIAIGAFDSLEGWEWFCAGLHWLVMKVFRLMVWGAIVSYVLGAFTSMFLIFRRDVDGLDFSDIARDPAEHAAVADAAPAAPPPPESSPSETPSGDDGAGKATD